MEELQAKLQQMRREDGLPEQPERIEGKSESAVDVRLHPIQPCRGCCCCCCCCCFCGILSGPSTAAAAAAAGGVDLQEPHDTGVGERPEELIRIPSPMDRLPGRTLGLKGLSRPFVDGGKIHLDSHRCTAPCPEDCP